MVTFYLYFLFLLIADGHFVGFGVFFIGIFGFEAYTGDALIVI